MKNKKLKKFSIIVMHLVGLSGLFFATPFDLNVCTSTATCDNGETVSCQGSYSCAAFEGGVSCDGGDQTSSC